MLHIIVLDLHLLELRLGFFSVVLGNDCSILCPRKTVKRRLRDRLDLVNVLGNATATRTWIALLFETACDCSMVPGARDRVCIDQLPDLWWLDHLRAFTFLTFFCPIPIIAARLSDLWRVHKVTLARSILAAVVPARLLPLLVFLEVL